MSQVAIEQKRWTDDEGNIIVPGDRVTVSGMRGRWVFISAWVKTDGVVDSVWVRGGPVYKGVGSHDRRRAFTPDRVRKFA